MTARPRPPIPAPNSGPRATGPGTVSLSESEEEPVREPGNDCKATSAVSRAQQRAAYFWSGAVRTPGQSNSSQKTSVCIHDLVRRSPRRTAGRGPWGQDQTRFQESVELTGHDHVSRFPHKYLPAADHTVVTSQNIRAPSAVSRASRGPRTIGPGAVWVPGVNQGLTRHDHVRRFQHEICRPWIIRLCSVKTTALEPRPPFPTQVAGRRPWGRYSQGSRAMCSRRTQSPSQVEAEGGWFRGQGGSSGTSPEERMIRRTLMVGFTSLGASDKKGRSKVGHGWTAQLSSPTGKDI